MGGAGGPQLLHLLPPTPVVGTGVREVGLCGSCEGGLRTHYGRGLSVLPDLEMPAALGFIYSP